MADTADTVIVGGGPAGLMAAIAAAGAGHRVVVCERLDEPGRKLLATGGGRCNLTHVAAPEELPAAFGRRGRFALPAFAAFPPAAIRAFFAAAGVPTVEEEDGCVFPASQRSRDVRDALRQLAEQSGATPRCGAPVTNLLVRDNRVTGVATDCGAITARQVVVAAGGCSCPALGADGSGFRLAVAAGHTVVPPVPALVPLVTVEEWPARLAGIVLKHAVVSLDGKGRDRAACTGPVLFTHRGVSGPPVLDLSGAVAARLAAADAAAAGPVTLRLAARADRDAPAWQALFETWRRTRGRAALHNLLSGELPRGLAETFCAQAELVAVTAATARREGLDRLARLCAGAPLTIRDTEGWERAMVTRGGVSLDEVEPRTMASRRVAGLFFAGEVLDLDGPCGGYNLTWAFASGRLAGASAAFS